MPFAIKDVLQHKRNDRQLREIHEKEYLKYLTNLQQQQKQDLHYVNQYYLSSNHIHEVERSHVRYTLAKQRLYNCIESENHILYDRLLKVNKRSLLDNKNPVYEQNLDSFNLKRFQQRSNEYKRIYNDNQVLLQRINNVPGHLINKKQCDYEWKKHVDVMKKTCDYPENIDKFVSKTQQKQASISSAMRREQWNDRHTVIQPSIQLKFKPLTILLDES